MKSVRGAALVAMAGVVLALFAERSVAAAPQSYESSPYTLTITFEGLVAFAPTGGPILTGDARVDQLWVLLPAVDGKQAEKAAKKMVKPQAFKPNSGKHPKHHTQIRVTSAWGTQRYTLKGSDGPYQLELYDSSAGTEHPPLGPGGKVHVTGFDRIPVLRDGDKPVTFCKGCASHEKPEALPDGTTPDLLARMVFRNGEEVSVRRQGGACWTYSDPQYGSDKIGIPAAVTVTLGNLMTGAALAVRRIGDDDDVARTIPLTPSDRCGHVDIHVMNLTEDELEGDLGDMSDPPFQHYKLLYLLAPLRAGGSTMFPYDDYIYPKRMMCPGNSGGGSGDPFCTTSGQGNPY
jgi:hypothetical protein